MTISAVLQHTRPNPDWGRFTVHGGDELERTAASLATSIRDAVSRHVPERTIRSLVLLGGYGRGEGGVEVTDRKHLLHNNFDILLVHPTRSAPPVERMRALRGALDELEDAFGVGIDVACQSERHLKWAPSLVMWYDMRHGHKTLLGDAGFVPGLTRFRADRIPEYDVRNLLINRAALLVLNHFLLDHVPDEGAIRRTVLKHTAKAIIGYGDALLHLHGRYHWSYRTKQERMRDLKDVPLPFRALYEEAAKFRLRPRYDDTSPGSLREWLRDLTETLEPVHLSYESTRLAAPDLQWSGYPDIAARRELKGDLHVVRRTASKLKNLVRPPGAVRGRRLPCGIAGRALGVRGLLPLMLPAVLYPRAREALGPVISNAFGLGATDGRELRRAFLRHWRDHADPNLDLSLRRVGLDPRILEPST